jgi:hypothetical protein
MSSATATLDFMSMARALDVNRAGSSPRTVNQELIPAEAASRMAREGQGFMQAPAFNGATVDQEGLTNNYGIEPAMYFATMPSVDQARNYLYQGLAATALVVTLIVTSVLAS